MSQKLITDKYEKVTYEDRTYYRERLGGQATFRFPTVKETKKHRKVYRKQVQTLFIKGKYETE